MPTARNRIVIFAQARSGSTVLYRALQLHPQLKLALEPFHGSYHSWNPGERNYVDLVKDIPTLEETLATLFSLYNGFKCLDYQLPEEIYAHMLLRHDIKVIALRRRNALQQAVSGFIAEQNGIWQKRDLNGDMATACRALGPIDLYDLQSRLTYGRELTQYYTQVLAKKPPGMCTCLYYEDLYTPDLARNREAFRRVFSFLGLSIPEGPELDALIDPRVEKINSIHTYTMIPNARIIDQEFGNAETGWLFQNDRT